MRHSTHAAFVCCSDELTGGSVPADVVSQFVTEKLGAGFVGRLDLLCQIQLFFDPTATERVLLITGEPGIGKSTVMCRLVSDGIFFPRDLLLSHPTQSFDRIDHCDALV